MWFVLIITLVFTTPQGKLDVVSTRQEYHNEESCEQAQQWVEKNYPTMTAECRQQI